MFKNFLELNISELEELVKFINRNKDSKLDKVELEKQMRAEECGYGKGYIVRITDNTITATAKVILKECIKKEVAYLINIDIHETCVDKRTILEEIIEESIIMTERDGAKQVFLGTGNEEIIKSLNEMKISKEYSAVKMILEDIHIKYQPFNLVPLSEDNLEEYLRIYNASFREVPNGESASKADVQNLLKESDEDKFYFIVEKEGEHIGFIQAYLDDKKGKFDMGLVKKARGKGNGAVLLETAIDFLKNKGVEEISLTVMTANEIAYNMYKKRGFKEEKKLGDWFKISSLNKHQNTEVYEIETKIKGDL